MTVRKFPQPPRAKALLDRHRKVARDNVQAGDLDCMLHDMLVRRGLHTDAFLPFHRRQEVTRLSREGKTVREIAAALGISYNHVSALRCAAGVSRTRKKRP